MQDRAFWDDIYRQGATPWIDVKRDYIIAQLIIRDTHVDSSMTVLDYGCADGTICEHLLNRGIKVDFSEISAIPVNRLKEKFGSKSKVFLASEPKEITGKYDIVVCCCVLHHVDKKKWPDFLNDFNRLLKSQGLLWLAGFDRSDQNTENNQGKFIATSDMCKFIDEIIPMAEPCGFEVVSNYVEDIPNGHLDTHFTTRFICLRKTNQ